jgi:hypothetical protein
LTYIQLLNIVAIIGYSTLLTKKRCAEAPTPKNINDEFIMSNKLRSINGGESAQPINDDDKINFAIPRRLVNLVGNACFQVSFSTLVFFFSPYLPSAQPKQPPLCPPSQSVTIPPKTFR